MREAGLKLKGEERWVEKVFVLFFKKIFSKSFQYFKFFSKFKHFKPFSKFSNLF
jgi:hypothetical protein